MSIQKGTSKLLIDFSAAILQIVFNSIVTVSSLFYCIWDHADCPIVFLYLNYPIKRDWKLV
jgi:hypothetical protein